MTWRGPIKILLIEDNDRDAFMIESELKRKGLDVDLRRVQTRHAFLTELKGFTPALILSDLELPFFNGFEALDLCRQQSQPTPFVLLTGATYEAIGLLAREKGADGFLLKNNLPRLPMLIQEVLGRFEPAGAA